MNTIIFQREIQVNKMLCNLPFTNDTTLHHLVWAQQMMNIMIIIYWQRKQQKLTDMRVQHLHFRMLTVLLFLLWESC